MKQKLLIGLIAGLLLMLSGALQTISASTFTDFIIRQSSGGADPTITHNPASYPANSIEFVTNLAGMKAGLGSNDINGFTIGDITSLSINRHDKISRLTTGSGPYVAPYLNIWITDGEGNFAVVANEPSNLSFQPLYNNGYDLSFSDLSDKTAKIYENNDKSWLPNNGSGLTFADLAAYQILAPSAAQLSLGWTGLGSGAPRELGTNTAYGVNWIFGDTLSNYVSGDEGFIVSGAGATASAPIPEPGTMVLLGFGLMSIAGIYRKKVTTRPNRNQRRELRWPKAS